MRQKKVVIITGASRGIGKAIALKLDKEGFIAVLVSRSPGNLKIALKDFSKRAIAIPADISKEKEVIAMSRKVIKKFKRIDVLINCAGSSVIERFDKISGKDFRKTVNTNLLGTLYCAKECVKQMKKQSSGGQIINISSVAAKIPSVFPSCSIHCATKSAIGAFSESVQSEMIRDRKKIKIAVIYPGFVFTESLLKRRTRDPEELRKYALRPEDIARVVLMIIDQGKNSNIGEVVIESAQSIPSIRGAGCL